MIFVVRPPLGEDGEYPWELPTGRPCRVHRMTLHTAPNKNRMSFCFVCVAAAVKARPDEFYLTDEFREMAIACERRGC